MIKFLRNIGFLSFLTTSVFAQDIEPKNPNDLITVCKEDKASEVCETRKNGKVVRNIIYQNGVLISASMYYSSGRLAKTMDFFNADAKTHIIAVYPDKDKKDSTYKKDDYLLILEDRKFSEIFNQERIFQQGVTIPAFYRYCKEDTPNGTKCDELNYFYPSSEPDLHPALALPIENQGLDVLKSNGIKIP